MVQAENMGIGSLALELVMQLSIGAICGYLLGRLAVLTLNKSTSNTNLSIPYYYWLWYFSFSLLRIYFGGMVI